LTGYDLYINGNLNKSNISGTSTSPVSTLSDGSYDWYVVARDLAGNQKNSTSIFTLNIDLSAPQITNITPLINSNINNNKPQISATFTETGSGINSSLGGLYLDGDANPVASNTNTGVSYVPTTPLSDNIHSVSVIVYDNLGNTSAQAWQFTIDTTAPDASAQPLPPNNYTKTFSIPYVADDAGSGVDFVNLYYSYSVNGNDSWTYWTQYGGNYATSPITFDTDLANGDGYYDFYIVATDKAGNPQAAPQGDDDEQATTYVKARSIDTPTGFFASVSDNKVNLKWNAVAGATSYEIYRSGSPYVLIATLTSNQTSYTDTGAIAGKDYHYKIIAINAGGYKSEAAVITTSITKIVAIPEASTITPEETQPETQIIPQAEAQTITPEVQPEETGKVLGDEKDEQETQNWTPLIVVISILILGIATYMGWKWYAEKGTESTEKKEDRW